MDIREIIGELSPEERVTLEQFLVNPAFMLLCKKVRANLNMKIFMIDETGTPEDVAREFIVLKQQRAFWLNLQQMIQETLDKSEKE